MNQKLTKMMLAVKAALDDDSSRERAEDLLSFVYKDLVNNSSNGSLAWRIMQQVGKPNPKKVRGIISAFHTHSSELEEAAKILGIEVELLCEPPF